jgi:hypothetical protein
MGEIILRLYPLIKNVCLLTLLIIQNFYLILATELLRGEIKNKKSLIESKKYSETIEEPKKL